MLNCISFSKSSTSDKSVPIFFIINTWTNILLQVLNDNSRQNTMVFNFFLHILKKILFPLPTVSFLSILSSTTFFHFDFLPFFLRNQYFYRFHSQIFFGNTVTVPTTLCSASPHVVEPLRYFFDLATMLLKFLKTSGLCVSKLKTTSSSVASSRIRSNRRKFSSEISLQ